MELLREWYLWGESDLLPYGVIIILLAAMSPGMSRPHSSRLTAGCLIVYGICELVVTFYAHHNWTLGFLCLFAGGAALSVAIGRLIRLAWTNLRAKR